LSSGTDRDNSAVWRSVEVIITPNRVVYNFEPEVVRAQPRGIIYEEVAPGMPNWLIASRTATPVEVGGGAGSTASGFVELVQFAAAQLDNHSLNTRIRQELASNGSVVRQLLRGHESGGVLVVVTVIVTYDPSFGFGVRGQRPIRNSGPTSRRVGAVSVVNGVFGAPAHAQSVDETRRRREGTYSIGTNPDCEYLEKRYFWARWAPRTSNRIRLSEKGDRMHPNELLSNRVALVRRARCAA
ncbi:MAG: hypothetical protein AB7O38_15450, partial [Pirellulaceae bacterium]